MRFVRYAVAAMVTAEVLRWVAGAIAAIKEMVLIEDDTRD
jgi:hypothetical protein